MIPPYRKNNKKQNNQKNDYKRESLKNAAQYCFGCN